MKPFLYMVILISSFLLVVPIVLMALETAFRDNPQQSVLYEILDKIIEV